MRFVYVEDEPEVQRQTLSWLRYERHEVTVFENAIDALNHVRGDEPEVLLCDYRLEGSPNGLVLAGQVRQLYPACTIVMVSHYAEKAEFERAFGAGCRRFRQPPHRLPVLLSASGMPSNAAALSFHRPVPRTLVSGPLVVDVGSRSATFDGEPFPLTPSEYEILHIWWRALDSR